MKTVWVIHAAYRKLKAQLNELEQLPAPSPPQEIWVIGAEALLLPQNEHGAPYRVIYTESSNPDVWLDLLEQASRIFSPDLLIFGSSEAAESVAVRLAYRTGGSCATGCCAIDRQTQDGLQVQRKVYCGHMLASLRLTSRPFCITSEKVPDQADTAACDSRASCSVWLGDAGCNKVPEPVIEPFVRPEGLSTASRLVAVGMGISGPEQLKKAEMLAEQLQAALGASRPVAMNGWLPMEQLLGVSGEIAAPQVCLLLGVSGAPAFWTGVERSRCIIAINHDANAPCLRWADVGAVADCHAFMEALTRLVASEKEGASSL